MAGNWTISYSENDLYGLAVHGVILIVNDTGTVVASFEGLATASDGGTEQIGAQFLGDKLEGYIEPYKSSNAQSPPIVVFTGTEADVLTRAHALQDAVTTIAQKAFSYQLPGIGDLVQTLLSSNGGTNTNSNSLISTMFAVLGISVPSSPYTTLLGQEGGQTILLTQSQINSITSVYGSNFQNQNSSPLQYIAPGPYAYTELLAQQSGVINGVTLTNSFSNLSIAVQPDGGISYNYDGSTVELSAIERESLAESGQIGAYVGSEVAALLFGNSALTNVATSSFFSTAGSLLATELNSGAILTEQTAGLAIANGFTQNFVVGAGGIAGNLLGSDLAAALGGSSTLRAVGSVIGSTFGQAVFATAFANLVPIINSDLDLTGSAAISTSLSANLLDNLDSASSLANLGVGLLDAVTGINVLDPEGGNPTDVSVGSAVGGLIGLFIPVPVAGSLIGQFIGGLFGSLFGEETVGPNVQAEAQISTSTGRFVAVITQDNDPSTSLYQTITEVGNAFTATLNAEIDGLGQASPNSSVTISTSALIRISYFVNTGESDDLPGAYTSINSPNPLSDQNSPNSSQRNFQNSMTSALSDAVIRQLSLMTVVGADAGMTMALTNSLILHDVNYAADAQDGYDASETIAQLNDDLQAESDYESYESNPVAFLTGYALRDPSNAAADWSAEYARASLLQSVTIYRPGEGSVSVNVASTANIGGMGMIAYDPTIQTDNVWVSRSGNNLVLSDSTSYYVGTTLTTSTGSVTIINAFNPTQPIANLNGVIGQVQFYNPAGYVSSYWTGIALTGLIAPNFNGSINLGSVQRDDGEAPPPNYNQANSYYLLMNNNETVSIGGFNADLAVLGSDTVTLTNTADDVYLTNNDTLYVSAGYALVNAAGNNTVINLTGNYNTLLTNGHSDVITINDHDDLVTVNGQSNLLTIVGASTGLVVNNSGTATVGNGDTLTVNGLNNTLTVDGSGDAYYVNGASGNTIDLAASDNFLQTAASTVQFNDGVQAWLYGGNDVTAIGNNDHATISGDGFAITETGTADIVGMNSSYSTVTVGGSGDQSSIIGNYDVVTLAGEGNSLIVGGAAAIIQLSGTNQTVQVSGATVTASANTQAIFNGTNHNTVGAPDYGNGNIIDLGNADNLTVTGSNNWVQAASNDQITMSDQNDGVGATGSGNAVTFSSLNDYADMSNSTLVLQTGASATLTGSGNGITMIGTSGLAIIGSNNTVSSNSSGDTISVGGGGNTLTVSGGTLTVGGPGQPPGNGNVFQTMGFDYDSYINGEYETAAASSSLQQLAATGANSVGINVTGYVIEPGNGTEDGTTIATSPSATSTVSTESNASIHQAVDNAEADGLSVFLRPQVVTSDGTWVADILTDQAPGSSEVQTFFANYDAFIMNYATLAAEAQVSMFSIGDEMASLSGSAYAGYWSTLIADVKGVFAAYGDTTTQLTYSAAYNEAQNVSFWSSLNVIGINAYETLTGVANPTLAQLEAGWTTAANTATTPTSPMAPQTFYRQLSSEYAKPILFTEVGYQSVNGTNELAGQQASTANVPNGNLYAEYVEQSQALEAFFDVFSQDALQPGGTLGSSSFVEGSDIWEWNPNASAVQTDDFSVQGKPALNVVESWYGPARTATNLATATLVGNSDILTVGTGYNVTVGGSNNTVIVDASATVTATSGPTDFQVQPYDVINLGAGAATVDATSSGGDYVQGGPGNIVFWGGALASTVQGGTGSRTVYANAGGGVFTGGSSGNNALIGATTTTQAGALTLIAAGSNNYLQGNAAGNDVLQMGSAANATIVSEFADDTVDSGAGSAIIVLRAASGADTVNLSTGAATVSVTGAANALVAANAGSLEFIGGTAASTVTGSAASETVYAGSGGGAFTGGTNGSNVLVGSTGSTAGQFLTLTAAGNGNYLQGNNTGDDLMQAGAAANATIVSEAGNDTITGGTGAMIAVLQGTSGRDTVNLATGAATVSVAGAAGAQVNASAGTVEFIGGATASTLTGGAGSETVFAGSGGGVFSGGTNGNNVLVGSTGSTAGQVLTLTAAGSSNYLQGNNSGLDLLQAGAAANATIVSEAGADTIVGGSGSAIIVLQAASGRDTVAPGSGAGTVSASGGASAIVNAGSGTLEFIGGTGAGTVTGGSGNETIFAGTGGGYFVASTGTSDVMVGGAGAATFVGGGDRSCRAIQRPAQPRRTC